MDPDSVSDTKNPTRICARRYLRFIRCCSVYRAVGSPIRRCYNPLPGGRWPWVRLRRAPHMSDISIRAEEHNLFPTKAISMQFTGMDQMNDEIYAFFASDATSQAEDYFQTSDETNLLDRGLCRPWLTRLRQMFQDGLTRWLQSERIHGDFHVETYLFPNFARQHQYTLAHNHWPEAQIVGLYYVKVPPPPPEAPEGIPPLGDSYLDYWNQDGGPAAARPAPSTPTWLCATSELHQGLPTGRTDARLPQLRVALGDAEPGRRRRLPIAANFTLRPGNATQPPPPSCTSAPPRPPQPEQWSRSGDRQKAAVERLHRESARRSAFVHGVVADG